MLFVSCLPGVSIPITTIVDSSLLEDGILLSYFLPLLIIISFADSINLYHYHHFPEVGVEIFISHGN